ncbi:hypothetical protein [Pseudonocardia oroxyli]|uniref:3-hydroxybutyryl-CoA dehydrogenase n=1 Tax=Pseudonocardia oroxyli TaxID=366584 RepID=A0A1G8DW82_PSEOR|nr:hypothetical protein [Pseudonocardia oroxyli]SDH61865.1 hypothetical protein SAMN05216377_1293 [Pseudonocardia oroxyli]
MTANAQYLKERFLDRGHLGLSTGRGYYAYLDPANEQPEFLSVPDLATAGATVDRVREVQR